MSSNGYLKPIRADIIGSFLRSDNLINARKHLDNKTIDYKDYRKIEKQEIIDVVQKQLNIGLKSVTDGEFTRVWSNLDFFKEIDGVESTKASVGYPFRHTNQPKESVSLCGKLHFLDHSVIENFVFLNEIVGDKAEAKVSIPAPSMFLFELLRPENKPSILKYYSTMNDFLDNIAKCCQKCIDLLYDAGCRHIQMDNNVWGVLLDENMRKIYKDRGYNIDELISMTSRLNIESFSKKPKDMRISMHICRGNYKSDWAFSGGYEPIADIMFSNPYISEFFLEYDTDRSGSFEPLRYLRDHQTVCLGLVSTKFPKLEDDVLIKTRVYEAAQYVELDRLAISPQCGFASTIEGNKLSQKEQWQKVGLVMSVAKNLWEDA